MNPVDHEACSEHLADLLVTIIFDKADHHQKYIREALRLSLAKTLQLTISIASSAYYDNHLNPTLSYSKQHLTPVIYSRLSYLYTAARDVREFNQSLSFFVYSWFERQCIPDELICDHQLDNYLTKTWYFHDTHGSPGINIENPKPFSALLLFLSPNYIIRRVAWKVFLSPLPRLLRNISNTIFPSPIIFWLNPLPRQHIYLRLLDYRNIHHVINTPPINLVGPIQLSSRLKVYDAAMDRLLYSDKMPHPKIIFAAIMLIPYSLFESATKNILLLDAFLRTHDIPETGPVFTCGSSIFDSHILAESLLRAKGISVIAVQHGSLSGYMPESPLTRFITFRNSDFQIYNTCFVPQASNQVTTALPSLQFAQHSPSFVNSLRRIRTLILLKTLPLNYKPKVLIALGERYWKSPLAQNAYTETHEDYEARVLSLVGALAESGFRVHIKGYSNAVTNANYHLYETLISSPLVQKIMLPGDSKLLSTDLVSSYDAVIVDMVSGLFSECSVMGVPVYSFLSETDFEFLYRNDERVTRLTSAAIISTHGRLICDAIRSELLDLSVSSQNSNNRRSFVSRYNLASCLSPKAVLGFNLFTGINKWSQFFSSCRTSLALSVRNK